jgi:hypothetical protein
MITKENYLSYFLLYIDKELSAEEAARVKAFAASNTFYKMELQQLMLATLKPEDENLVANKATILKPTLIIVDGINEQNYEMYFSASLDNELSKAEETALGNFLYKNPLLESELEVWQKCKLEKPTLVFEHKNLLYRKEEKKPLFIYFKPLAAAAILFLSLGLFWVYNYNVKSNNGTPTASTDVTSPANTVISKAPPKLDNNLDAVIPLQKNEVAITENKKSNLTTPTQNPENKTIINFYPKDNYSIDSNKEINESVAINKVNEDALTLAESKIIKQQIFIEKNNVFDVTNSNLSRNTYSGTITIENEAKENFINAKYKEEENDSEVLLAGQKIEGKKRTNIFAKLKNFKNKLNEDIPIKIGKKYIIL